MGTRFLASPEAEISKGHQGDVLRARDGGVSTGRTTIYDRLRGTVGWPNIYGGRGVLNHSFWDHEKGMDESENRRLYEEALKSGDDGWGEKGRVTAYAGTGVGLISEVKPAAAIVNEVREDSRKVLERSMKSRL
jgi:nitronate monooxygenase